MIERLNQSIKSKLAQIRVQKGNVKIDVILPDILDNINSSKHDVTQFAPEDLHKVDLDEASKKKAHDNILARAKRSLRTFKKTFAPLNVGDKVRIAMTTLEPSLRSVRGKLKQKKDRIMWSKKVYIVASKSRGSDIRDPEYELSGLGRKFQRDSLQRIDIVESVSTIAKEKKKPKPPEHKEELPPAEDMKYDDDVKEPEEPPPRVLRKPSERRMTEKMRDYMESKKKR